MHRCHQERVQLTRMTRGFIFQFVQDGGEGSRLFTLGEDLHAVMVVANVFLVYAEHRYEHIE